jgi:hypothetical protein
MEAQFPDGIIMDNVEAFSPFIANTLSSLYRLQSMGVSVKTVVLKTYNKCNNEKQNIN